MGELEKLVPDNAGCEAGDDSSPDGEKKRAEAVKSDFGLIKGYLFKADPFFASILSKMKVVVVPRGDRRIVTAAVDSRMVMYINSWFWYGISWEDKKFVVMHEAMHLSFMDPARLKGRDHEMWNIACDAANNSILLDSFGCDMADKIVTVKSVNEAFRPAEPVNDNDQKEVIYEKISAGSKGGRVGRIVDVMIDARGEQIGGVEIQSGDPSIYSGKSPQEVEEAIKEAVMSAYSSAKIAGKLGHALEVAITELISPKLPWKSMLKSMVKGGISRSVVSTWRVPSRRFAEMPGCVKKSLPRVWCLVDVSGSISSDELVAFASELLCASKGAKVTAVYWSDEVHCVREIKSKKDVEKSWSGGGTVVDGALELVSKSMRNGDVVVVLSDSEVSESDEAARLASGILDKASAAVLAYTGKEVCKSSEKIFRGWKKIGIS